MWYSGYFVGNGLNFVFWRGSNNLWWGRGIKLGDDDFIRDVLGDLYGGLWGWVFGIGEDFCWGENLLGRIFSECNGWKFIGCYWYVLYYKL